MLLKCRIINYVAAKKLKHRTGVVLMHGLLAPSPVPQEDMLAFLDELIKISGKPSVIEISDREIESYISDVCQQAGIHLVYKQKSGEEQTTCAPLRIVFISVLIFENEI